MQITIKAFMMSCESRVRLRKLSLESFLKSDCSAKPHVRVCTTSSKDPVECMTETCYRILSEAVQCNSDFIIFVEDDIRINAFIRHNLERWRAFEKFRIDRHFMGSLYNPRALKCWGKDCQQYSFSRPDLAFGSQAILLSTKTVKYIIQNWDKVNGPQDAKIFQIGSQVVPLVFHVPSLVQHIGILSTWGGPYHRSVDFSPDWKSMDRQRHVIINFK